MKAAIFRSAVAYVQVGVAHCVLQHTEEYGSGGWDP